MLSQYNYLDEMYDLRSIHQQGKVRCTIIASELMDDLGYSDNAEFQTALMRSFEVCTALKIPIKNNFKRFYKLQNQELVADWYLSDLGAYLITINGNTCNPNVAKAQLQFLLHLK